MWQLLHDAVEISAGDERMRAVPRAYVGGGGGAEEVRRRGRATSALEPCLISINRGRGARTTALFLSILQLCVTVCFRIGDSLDAHAHTLRYYNGFIALGPAILDATAGGSVSHGFIRSCAASKARHCFNCGCSYLAEELMSPSQT
jgi:hypothetical protein